MADDSQPMSGSRIRWQENVKRIADQAIDGRIATWNRNARWFAAGLGVLGVAGLVWQDLRLLVFEKLYPPSQVYERLKVSLRQDEDLRLEVANDIVKLLGERVDSGYSKTIVFGSNVAPVYGQDFMQFYARPKQKVELTIRTQGDELPDSQPASFTITINNVNIFENDKNQKQKIGYARFGADVSPFLRFDRKPTLDLDPERDLGDANVFTLRVIPIDLEPGAWASFEILVLVRNETAQ